MSNNTTILFEFVNKTSKELYNNQNTLSPSTKYSAGIDLRFAGINTEKLNVFKGSFEDNALLIQPNASVLLNTGLKCFIPTGYVLKLYARSGLALTQGLTLGNCVGIVDADYADEIRVILLNTTTDVQKINIGDRIAQAILEPVINFTFESITDKTIIDLHNERNGVSVDNANIRNGGFGSTGL